MISPGSTPLLGNDPGAIGQYRIIGRLGVGGMATVYLAEADRGSYVAIKLVHDHLASDSEFLARFEREIRLAAQVPAHCTAAMLDKGVHGDRPYLVTEYLAGTTLHRLVGSVGPLDPASAHNIAIGLAAGLTAIHDCDLVHRDLKPSNVMVTRGGVRIIDFGIARTLDTSTDFTRSGFMMGSLGWTSPEQLEGCEPLPAMDVFAWGCVMAYAATGRHPFGGDDAVARSWRILNDEPDLSGVPDSLADLVAAALDRDAERRPTAQELLLGLVGGATPMVKVRAAVPAAAAAPAAGPAPRRSRWAFLAVAVPLIMAAAVALSASSSNGVMVDQPMRTGSPTGPSAPAPVVSTGGSARPQAPTGDSRPGSIAPPTDAGAAQRPSETGAQRPSETDRPGNGNGNGNRPSRKPKG